MAFRSPHAIVRDGAVVVFDESWRPLAEQLAGDMPRARADVAATLGVTRRPAHRHLLYSTPTEVTAYLGQTKVLERRALLRPAAHDGLDGALVAHRRGRAGLGAGAGRSLDASTCSPTR